MNIPVLTYHSTNILGNEYHNNDHIAFGRDLTLIQSMDLKILPAYQLVQWLLGKLILDPNKRYVTLTFDDGCELDYIDWKHPKFGNQNSFYTLMKDYSNFIHATSFVIASPNDRKILEQTCLEGHPIWGDAWWQHAENSGIFAIENHSWDHLHETLDNVKQQNNEKGDFKKINTLEDASHQILWSANYIDSKIENKSSKLFAYPYGHFNKFLVEDFFPLNQDKIQACFTCEPQYSNRQSNIWKIPRFVCGENWKSIKELEYILSGSYKSPKLS